MKEEFISTWFKRSLDLELDEELYISCTTKQERTEVLKKLNKLNSSIFGYKEVMFKGIFKDKRHWITAKIIPPSSGIGWLKKDGELIKIDITENKERRRMIKLMFQDGLTLEDMNNALDEPLTDHEIEEYF